jgi:hypothetical protein
MPVTANFQMSRSYRQTVRLSIARRVIRSGNLSAPVSASPGGKEQRIEGFCESGVAAGTRPLLWQSQRGQYIFYFVQEFGKSDWLTSVWAGVMGLGIDGRAFSKSATFMARQPNALNRLISCSVSPMPVTANSQMSRSYRQTVRLSMAHRAIRSVNSSVPASVAPGGKEQRIRRRRQDWRGEKIECAHLVADSY